MELKLREVVFDLRNDTVTIKGVRVSGATFRNRMTSGQIPLNKDRTPHEAGMTPYDRRALIKLCVDIYEVHRSK